MFAACLSGAVGGLPVNQSWGVEPQFLARRYTRQPGFQESRGLVLAYQGRGQSGAGARFVWGLQGMGSCPAFGAAP